MTSTETDATESLIHTAPAKVLCWVERALVGGLTMEENEAHGTMRSWTISSPNPIDPYQLWLYFHPGRNGGSLRITHWRGHLRGKGRKTTCRVTLRQASLTLTDMIDSLKRHRDREAKKAQAALDAVTLSSCGCPVAQVVDAGHQEGCKTGEEEVDRAERFGLTIQQLRSASDPTRPEWFSVGQGIHDHATGTSYQVAAIGKRPDGSVASVAVSVNGGYGRELVWYGNAPGAVGGLGVLEHEGIGLDDSTRRPWPRGLAAAHEAVRNVLIDQRLSGWAAGRLDPDRIVVNVPNCTDPTRHLILLERYVPYHCTVRLRRGKRNRDRYPIIEITPKER